jgi:hypothetical protein
MPLFYGGATVRLWVWLGLSILYDAEPHRGEVHDGLEPCPHGLKVGQGALVLPEKEDLLSDLFGYVDQIGPVLSHAAPF